MDVAAWEEVAFDGDGERVAGGYEVIHDEVDRFFVRDIAIAKAIDVELDGF